MLSTREAVGLISSCVTFQVFNHLLDLDILPRPPGCDDSYKRYKWKNITGSFVHAVYVGIAGVYCLYLTPAYLTDRVETFEDNAALMTAASMGYFLYDAINILRNQKLSRCWAMILHHMFVFGIGVTFLWRERLLAYGMTCTIVELNGMFLHLRQLLLLYGVQKQAIIYKINLVINIISFAILRIGVFIIVVIWILNDRPKMPVWENNMLLVDDVGLLILNVVVFYRILKADVLVRVTIDTQDKHDNCKNGKVQQQSDVMDW